MIEAKQNFYKKPISHCGAIFALILALISSEANCASVVARGSTSSTNPTTTAARPSIASRVNVASRLATSISTTQEDTSVSESETVEEEETKQEPELIIQDKSSKFSEVLSYNSGLEEKDSSEARLAEMVASQRAQLNAQASLDAVARTTGTGNQSQCDLQLRQCMQEKCGSDFTGCAGDTDTDWGDKMDSCRLHIDATCTGTAYQLFAAEIKADRDLNAQLAAYQSILDCGNSYNDCIVTQCGTTFSKCLGKTAGDTAIAKCKTIADNCIEQDSGLSARAMDVFARLRVDAEEQVQRDMERLEEIREKMVTECQQLGALFDERTFSCVFTVEFYGGDDGTLYASKKAYAGDIFDCTPNWFGIDVTTFMENAYRATREQSSATAGFMGSGLGVAAGAITSGAISRAIDRTKAENALKDAEKEAEYTANNSTTDSENDNAPTTDLDTDKNDNTPTDANTDNDKGAENSDDDPNTNGNEQTEKPAEDSSKDKDNDTSTDTDKTGGETTIKE